MERDERPLVAIILGSDSDLPTMRETCKMLEKLGVPFTTRITSAHRSPRRTHALAGSLAILPMFFVVVPLSIYLLS